MSECNEGAELSDRREGGGDVHAVMQRTSFAQAALAKLAPVPEGFRIYYGGSVEVNPPFSGQMRVKGAVFREATRGPNKGRLCIRVHGTERAVTVTPEEIAIHSVADPKSKKVRGMAM
jgi:hypothetical protein